jgi:HK97 family phage major capsid protein
MKADDCLRQAAALITSSQSFTKEREAQVRALRGLAESAAGIAAQPKRPGRVDYASRDQERAFTQFLATGVAERRDMGSGSGAFPGSGSGYFTPTGFFPAVTAMLKQLDDLFDENVVTVIQTDKAGPVRFPVLADENSAAVIVDENITYTNVDAPMNGVIMPRCKKWGTGFFCSLELTQDSGVPLDVWVAAAFAVRLQRGFGASNVTTLLSGATKAATCVGSSGNTGGSETGATSVGSDDLLACVSALDAAYLASPKVGWVMNQKTLTSILATKSKQGNLVYPSIRDGNGVIYLLDLPVRICPSMPNIATGNKPIALADLARFVIREVKSGMMLQVFVERAPELGQIYYRGDWRSQSALIQTNNSPADPSPAVYLQNA